MEKLITRKKLIVILLALALLFGMIPMVGDITDVEPASAAAESDTEISKIVNQMSLREKITQCFMIDFRQWNDSEGKKYDMTTLDPEVAGLLADYKFGSVILFAENIKDTADTLQLTKDMQAATMSKGGIPLLIATDQEGGIVYRLGSGTALPGNMAVAASGKQENAQTAGEIIGRELQSLGINTTLAPVLDVNNNASNSVIGPRSFSDDPELVGTYGNKYISGLNEYNIIGCAKHFPGHGDTATDSHYGLPIVNKTKEELEAMEFIPFKIAINNGIDMIMTAHILYPLVDDSKIYSEKTKKEESTPATLSHKILTDILRGEMNFNGVVVTDAMNMKGVSDNFTEGQAAAQALIAGADLVCMPVTGVTDKTEWTTRVDAVIDRVTKAVNDGVLKEARLNEAVTRVLTMKKKKGILNYNEQDFTKDKALSTVGSNQNRTLERVIAAEAVTLIKNKGDVLPYKASSGTKILFLNPYENELAQMVMGLNRAKVAGKVPSDVEVIPDVFSEDNYEVQGELKKDLDWADVVIINSETSGTAAMAYKDWRSMGPKNFTEYCKKNGKTSIVLSSNRPYDVQLYPDADAILAVYGAKGSTASLVAALTKKILTDKNAYGPNLIAGVEVLFGVFDATGTLPVNIPVFDPKTGEFTKDVKYPRGYGLTYKEVKPEPAPAPTPSKKIVVTAKAKIKSVKVGKRKLTVKAKVKASTLKCTRYQLAYKVKGAKKWKYKSSKSKTIKLKHLKKGKHYKVKLRAVKVVDGKAYYGPWSKKQTTKKVK